MPPQTSLSSSSSLHQLLAQHRISPRFAFLLEHPEERLPVSFSCWHEICDSLPDLIESGVNVRELISNLPELEIPSSFSYEQLRLSHLLLCTLVSAFLWADKKTDPPSSLPRCLSLPFHSVSLSLGMKPVVSHHSTCLANWRRISGVDVDGSTVVADNLDLIAFRFLKTSGNVWFFTLNAQLEFDFAPAIVAAASICHKGASSTSSDIDEKLDRIITAVNACAALFVRFRERLTPSEFYHGLRPYLWGYANIKKGVVFEGVDSSPSRLPGASAAQSCTIQTIDAFLGVKHNGAEDKFLREQRDFIPAPHRAFIEWIETTAQSAPLHSLIHSHPKFPDALRALDNFRSQHIRVVSLFISSQSSNSIESGTGGTPLIQFLKTVRADSNDVMPH